MEFKHRDPIVPSGNPFQNCSTGRKRAGESLTEIVNSMDLGGTIAITGAWGTGKTTFLRMWQQDLNDKGYPTYLLNAWETEWAEDPLIAVIASVQTACKNKENKEALDSISSSAKKFLRKPQPIVSAILKAAIEKLTGVDVSELSEEIKNLQSKAFDEAISDFTDKKEAMVELKQSFEKLAWDKNQGAGSNKPLIFIIDELDRCKPDYSVRMLEVLKHFFEVRNIIFVCAIDKKHMEDAIKGYYGSEGLNAAEYLRRFFHLEIELPSPDYKKFCEHLYEFYHLEEFFESSERLSSSFRHDSEEFKSFFASLAQKGNLTLRQMERICAFTKLSLPTNRTNIYFFTSLSLFLTYLRFFDFDFYQDIKKHQMTVQDLVDKVESEYGGLIDGDNIYRNSTSNRRTMLFMIAKLASSYNNEFVTNQEKIYDNANKTSSLTSSIFSKEDFDHALGWAHSGHDDYELTWLYRMLDILKIDES